VRAKNPRVSDLRSSSINQASASDVRRKNTFPAL
jgi:hypothetical protein